MAIVKKTLFVENLDKIPVSYPDTDPSSKYFKITELPETFTGGKNAFLIQGSEYLVADSLVKIELKDSNGEVIYHEPGEGYFSSSISGSDNKPIITEYYEGVSKVVSVYIYSDTSFGPCTLTILGELAFYDNNGIKTPVSSDAEGFYNVKWQKQINVNPSLANTTKIRFYQRPQASISEIISPVFRIENGLKVNSGVNQSFANIKLNRLETFAGDVKRVKVFRTSDGNISDFDLIQDILVESKELLTTFDLSGSVIGNTGIFTQETLKNFWNTGSLNVELTQSRVESGVKLNGNGNFIYTQSLDIQSANTYELNLDAFYSSSVASNLEIYLSYTSQSTTFSSSIVTLAGISPTKNFLDTTIPFKIDKNFPSASLYFSISQGEWHLGNISLRLSEDTAFSPDEISFITTMPTLIGNEDFNFKFEFYDVNNNFVPVSVTASANFTGGTSPESLLISTSLSQSTALITAISSSISGTATLYSSSANTTIVTLSGSVSGTIGTVSSSVFTLSGSVSGTIGTVSSSVFTLSGSVSGTIGVLSGSVSSSITSLSSSVSASISNAKADAFAKVQLLANGGYPGTFIENNLIYSPVIGGQLGYFSELFKVGTTPSIYLDARQNPRKIFIGGVVNASDTVYNEYSGAFNNTNTNVYLDSTGKFSLGNKLTFDGTNLSVNGSITITNPSTANNGGAVGSFSNGDALTGGSIAGLTLTSTKIFIGTGTHGNANTGFYVDSSGKFSLKDKLVWDGTTLSIIGNLSVGSSVPNSVVTGLGGLATQNTVSTGQVTGLGGLATRNSVGSGEIDADAVTNAKIAADAVTEGKLAANAVTEGKISANAVVAGKIAANAVTADKIAAGSITAGKIVAGAITADKIDASAITADKIATNAITADKILAGAVTAAKVDVAGVITAGSIVVAGNNISTLTNNSGFQANGDAKTGGSVGGWTITSTEIQGGSPSGGGNAAFTSQGIRLGASGYISAKNFYIDTSGNAAFTGDLSGASGTFGSTTINSSGLAFGNFVLSSSGIHFANNPNPNDNSNEDLYTTSLREKEFFTQRIRLYQNKINPNASDSSLGFDFLYSQSGLTTLGVDSSGQVKKVSSSRKYKKEIESLPLETAKRILDLNIVSFKDKDTEVSNTPHAGLIAEEVDDLNYKDWVIYDNSGSVDGVFYQSVFSSMVKVVQDLNKRVEELEAKLSGSI